MAILCDASISRMYPGINPGPASIDLSIGDTLLVWPDYVRRDPRLDQSDVWKPVTALVDDNGPSWVLRPGYRYLAATAARIRIRHDLAGFVSARSSWGRDGLAVICGPAGFLDPGYLGHPTLELSVIGSELVLWPGAKVAQLTLHQLDGVAARPYGHRERSSKYQFDAAPQPSRTHLEVVR